MQPDTRSKGALYLDDVTVLDDVSEDLLVLSFILLLLQLCCMLGKKTETLSSNLDVDCKIKNKKTGYTCNFLNRSPCVLLFPCFPCLAFQNCFWAEYLFIGHTLKRQSAEEEKQSNKPEHSLP